MDKAQLFEPRLPEADVELPGVGTIRVRGLNRGEGLALQKIEDLGERDRHMIAMGVIDPQLSVSEVKRWSEAAPVGELERVSDAIARLSGMLEGADSAAYKSAPDESGPTV